jgi:membrane protein YqaA with SNARE-associated domain
MDTIVSLLYMLGRLGAAGLFLMGILDSSFLFLPFGNDLLILSLASRNPVKVAWFAFWGAAGSVAGSMLVDAVARKGGEEGLSRILPPGRIEYVKRKVRKRAGWAIAVSALLPPPFPFTPFVAAAAALQFPRTKMIAVLMSARMLRFCLVGMLGVAFGPAIHRMAGHPAVKYGLLALLVICIVGSILSVAGWIRRSRHTEVAAASV